MSQKKILLLGGSAQQVIAIKTAKELGYYTVLCDYLPDNPGQYVADKYYNASTTDVEAVYQIARTNRLMVSLLMLQIQLHFQQQSLQSV